MVNHTVDLVNKHKYYNNNFFAKWAKLYDYEKYFLFPIRRKAARFIGVKPPQKVIDVAAGTGALTLELARIGYDVIGIDLSKEMLQQAQKKCNPRFKLKFQQADATELPFNDNYFDISTISWGLHDMPHDIEILVLEEMKRVTKNGGLILIVDYMEPKKTNIARIAHSLISLYETPNYKPFIEKGINNILNEVGMKIDRKTDWHGLIQIILVNNNK